MCLGYNSIITRDGVQLHFSIGSIYIRHKQTHSEVSFSRRRVAIITRDDLKCNISKYVMSTAKETKTDPARVFTYFTIPTKLTLSDKMRNKVSNACNLQKKY